MRMTGSDLDKAPIGPNCISDMGWTNKADELEYVSLHGCTSLNPKHLEMQQQASAGTPNA